MRSHIHTMSVRSCGTGNGNGSRSTVSPPRRTCEGPCCARICDGERSCSRYTVGHKSMPTAARYRDEALTSLTTLGKTFVGRRVRTFPKSRCPCSMQTTYLQPWRGAKHRVKQVVCAWSSISDYPQIVVCSDGVYTLLLGVEREIHATQGIAWEPVNGTVLANGA